MIMMMMRMMIPMMMWTNNFDKATSSHQSSSLWQVMVEGTLNERMKITRKKRWWPLEKDKLAGKSSEFFDLFPVISSFTATPTIARTIPVANTLTKNICNHELDYCCTFTTLILPLPLSSPQSLRLPRSWLAWLLKLPFRPLLKPPRLLSIYFPSASVFFFFWGGGEQSQEDGACRVISIDISLLVSFLTEKASVCAQGREGRTSDAITTTTSSK